MKTILLVLLCFVSVFAINPKTQFESVVVKDSIIDSALVGGGIVTATASGKLTVPPLITSLTNTSTTNYVGQTVSAVTVNWTLSGGTITSQSLTDCTPALSDRTHSFSALSLTSDKYYTLTITNGSTQATATTWLYFYIQKWYGTSSSATPSAGNIQGGSNTWSFQDTTYRAMSSTNITGGGNYCYYAYPASWGDIKISVNGFSSTWNKTTVSLTNSYGDTRNYYVYTSPTTIVGTISLSAIGN